MTLEQPSLDGVHVTRYADKSAVSRPALLMDRDGVLVEEVNFLRSVGDVRLAEGAADIISLARRMGWAVAVVSNQSGIARNLFGWSEYSAVEQEIARQLALQGAGVDLVVACAFHPDHTPNYGDMHALWRKPGPRMLQLAADLINLDLKRSWIVGDRLSDLEAGHAAGLAGGVHLLTGYGKRHRSMVAKKNWAPFETLFAGNLNDAATCLAGRLTPA